MEKLKENQKIVYKKRLKISIEKIRCIKNIRPKRMTKTEMLYSEAKVHKANILRNTKILSKKKLAVRTDDVYNGSDLQEIVKLGEKIRVNEIKTCLLIMAAAIGTIVGGIGIVVISNAFILSFFVPLLIFLEVFFLYPKVTFKKYYSTIYLPVCYYCANIKDNSENLKFNVSDKKQSWDKDAVDKKIITNKFDVKTAFNRTNVERMIIRNNITTYSQKHGQLIIGKKIATVFSGYSFDMKLHKAIDKNNINNLLLAIINKDTFFGTNGIDNDEMSEMSIVNCNYPLLNNDWTIYKDNALSIDKNVKKEIQKKMIMIKNEIGNFNAYITGDSIRVMIGIQSNRDGIEEEFFRCNVNNAQAFSFNGFFSIVKALYIIACMEKMVNAVYGFNANYINKDNDTPTFVERKKDRLLKRTNTNQNKKNINQSFKKIMSHKSGETSINVAVGMLISVVLAAVLFTSACLLVNGQYIPGVAKNSGKSFSENVVSDTVQESDLLQEV